MADRMLILNDILCFLFAKYGKINLKTLKSILCDFFIIDNVNEAKSLLVDDIMKLTLTSKPPYMPKRRDGDNRFSREIDDLINLMNFIDEHGLRDKLPRYVTDHPDQLPGVHLQDSDLKLFVSWVEKLDRRMNNFESTVSTIASNVQLLQTKQSEMASTVAAQTLPPVVWPSVSTYSESVMTKQSVDNTSRGTSTISTHYPLTGRPTGGAVGTSTVNDCSTRRPVSNWAEQMSTPNRFSALSSNLERDVLQDDVEEDVNNPFQVFHTKKRLRQLSRQQQEGQAAFSSVHFPTDSVTFGTTSSAQSVANRTGPIGEQSGALPRRGPLIVGKRSLTSPKSSGVTVFAAKQFPKSQSSTLITLTLV